MVKQIILTIVVLILGAVGVILIKKNIPEAEKKEIILQDPVVKVQQFSQKSESFNVTGSGTVLPSEIIQVLPQVPGEVVYISENMKNGGFVKKGELLFRIDPTEYKLRVKSARSQIAGSELKLNMEKEEQGIAQSQWNAYKEANPNAAPGALTLKKPQVQLAEEQLAAAKSQLALAELSLKRTEIRSPINGRVKSRKVSRGQIVAPGAALAVIYGTDQVEITVPVPVTDADYIAIPQRKGDLQPKATLTSTVNGQTYTWEGRLNRDEAEVDLRNRTINLIITVNNPYDKKYPKPLSAGMFVNVAIEGGTLANVIKVPNSVFMSDGHIRTVENSTMKLKKVTVTRAYKGYSYISKGITSNDWIVTSKLDENIDGMKVKVIK